MLTNFDLGVVLNKTGGLFWGVGLRKCWVGFCFVWWARVLSGFGFRFRIEITPRVQMVR